MGENVLVRKQNMCTEIWLRYILMDLLLPWSRVLSSCYLLVRAPGDFITEAPFPLKVLELDLIFGLVIFNRNSSCCIEMLQFKILV